MSEIEREEYRSTHVSKHEKPARAVVKRSPNTGEQRPRSHAAENGEPGVSTQPRQSTQSRQDPQSRQGGQSRQGSHSRQGGQSRQGVQSRSGARQSEYSRQSSPSRPRAHSLEHGVISDEQRAAQAARQQAVRERNRKIEEEELARHAKPSNGSEYRTVSGAPHGSQEDIDDKLAKIKNTMRNLEDQAVGQGETEAETEAYAAEKPAESKQSSFRKSAERAAAIRDRKEQVTDEDFNDRPSTAELADKAVRSKSRIVTAVLCLILLAAVAVVYMIGYNGFKGRYLRNTFVNGVNISGVKIGQADTLIANAASSSGITIIKDNDEKVKFKGEDYGCKYSVPQNASYGNESAAGWFKKYFTSTNYNVELDCTYSENALRALIQNYNWGEIPPSDAYIEKGSDGKYSIVDDQHGDMLDNKAFAEYVVEQVAEGSDTIYVDKADCYLQAEVTSDALQAELDLINATGSSTLTIKIGNEEEVIDSDTLSEWVSLDADGQLQIDNEAITRYVSTLSDEYNTYGKERTINAVVDGTITVPWTGVSNYGWEINEETMVTKIVAALKDMDDAPITAAFDKVGYGEYSKDDIGDTYIEADISEQHFWLFTDGELTMDADFVSGTATDPERATPTGINCIFQKSQNVILGTYEVQGYETPVDYWMPFNYVGCGFHDLNRSAYGGSIYMYNGSHGCLNLSHEIAKELYNNIEAGIPVIIHD